MEQDLRVCGVSLVQCDMVIVKSMVQELVGV